MTYTFGPCTCGHSITVEADSGDEALARALDKAPDHFAEFHPGESMPPREQLEPMLRQLMSTPA
jgi:hypothetical protein